MILNSKIDIDFVQDKLTFEKIQIQKSIFIKIFTEIANLFPQSKLEEIHKRAKGSKVSNGMNLENCPYQVLDLIRDFDATKGYNIRILNWWGHGLYIFIQFGREIITLYENTIFENLSEFHIGTFLDPFDYKSIITTKKKLTKTNFKNCLKDSQTVILHKKISYLSSQARLQEVLLENINLILDKDS
ncbi:hypothetical protein Belba_2261 [Belliella baltica DSM 15883]|uniref:Uncharacterized protein n=1 Tax=Belliella baltica (strain DSM 15883 / CIP 108006 / LMG 21964 / BA134) TaxID=866536 RepID=I3Z6F8_BELBD|nr:hypothetical protein [Belliella baltica]AFL84826.1 hypothetical protein Belba_2261 [Belliella baltica DSM 15883]